MSLILRHTMTGALWWRGETFSQPWELPEKLHDLGQELETWYQARPIHDELMPLFDEMGRALARKISNAVGYDVAYLPASRA